MTTSCSDIVSRVCVTINVHDFKVNLQDTRTQRFERLDCYDLYGIVSPDSLTQEAERLQRRFSTEQHQCGSVARGCHVGAVVMYVFDLLTPCINDCTYHVYKMLQQPKSLFKDSVAVQHSDIVHAGLFNKESTFDIKYVHGSTYKTVVKVLDDKETM